MIHMHKKGLIYMHMCYGQLMIILLLVHYLVILTAGSKDVLCVANKHIVLGSLNQIRKIMVVTDDIYRMTTRSKDKRGRSMENMSSYHHQYL